MNKDIDLNVLAIMQAGKPFKTYKKTILGQVYCSVLSPLTNEPEGILLSGDPTKDEPDSMFDVWTETQDMYFRKLNKKHLETGMIIAYTRKTNLNEIVAEPFATASDEELDQILLGKYYTILSALNKSNNIVILNRFLERARVLEKSAKIVDTIIARISEVESGKIEKQTE